MSLEWWGVRTGRVSSPMVTTDIAQPLPRSSDHHVFVSDSNGLALQGKDS